MPHIKNALIRYRIIDKCIRNEYKPYPTKEDLRFACEEALYGDSLGEHICDSTIEKDLFAMRMEHDAPIKYSRRFGGYYYTDKNFSINEIPLSADDIASIKFAASTLAQFQDADIFKQFGFALNKILDRVSTSDNDSSQLADQYVQFETGTTQRGNDYLAPLLSAIKDQKVVYFNYQSFISGEKKVRKVTPLLLKEYRNRWYLIAFDLIKKSIITYGLDRMAEVELSEEKGEMPRKFNPDLYFKYTVGITTSDQTPEKIRFEASPVAAKYIDSQPFHESQQQLQSNSKGTTFELHVLITEELIRSFLSYANEIKVLQPDSLKKELLKRMNATIDLYN